MRDWRISSPHTPAQWQAYYHLRWQLLRQPWQQPPGSEKDAQEAVSIHRMAIRDHRVIGVGRLHVLKHQVAQIRYMAVAEDWRKRGVGKAILDSLEASINTGNIGTTGSIREPLSGIKKVQLHSRQDAIGFYQQQGYSIVTRSHVLYGEISHYLMQKTLA